VGETPTFLEYGWGRKSSIWGLGQVFEEDVDGNQGTVFLADEVASMDIVHTNARQGVLENEVIVEGTSGTPSLGGEIGYKFRLGGMRAFNVGLHGPYDAVATGVS
jgi:hypothetical protein